jgi:hypothetical protein
MTKLPQASDSKQAHFVFAEGDENKIENYSYGRLQRGLNGFMPPSNCAMRIGTSGPKLLVSVLGLEQHLFSLLTLL